MTVHWLAAISLYFFLLFVPLGCVATFVVGFLYTRSSNYCRDCDTGLALMLLGFCFSAVVTLIVLVKFGSPFGKETEVESNS